MDLFVGKKVQHQELGQGEVLDVWSDVSGKNFWACVMFNSGAAVTCKDTTLQEATDGNA